MAPKDPGEPASTDASLDWDWLKELNSTPKEKIFEESRISKLTPMIDVFEKKIANDEDDGKNIEHLR